MFFFSEERVDAARPQNTFDICFFSYLHDNEARDVTDSIMFLLIVAKKMLLKCSVKEWQEMKKAS